MAGREDRTASGTDPGPQDPVDAYFGERAAYWRDIYEQDGLQGLVYRERMGTVLNWIDALSLPPGSRVLEAGCGAGLATLELARRGFAVESIDSSSEMVALASRRVAEAGLSDAVTVSVADVHALPQASGGFALAIALGVLPWLHSFDHAIAELARVLAPEGHLIITADNRMRLNMLVEPSENPLLAPIKVLWRAARRRRGWRPNAAAPRLHRPTHVDQVLVAAGLEPERRGTVGFGPFTFHRRSFLGDRVELRLHLWLQRLANRGVPGFRLNGWHYVVSARRTRSV